MAEDLTSIKVDIDGQEYCLGTVPTIEDKVVKDVVDDINKCINLPAMAECLLESADFWRIAHYGVVGNEELRSQVLTVGYDVSELCKETDTTIMNYRHECVSVIDYLRLFYDYLGGDDKGTAIQKIKKVAGTAVNLAKCSEKLAAKFKSMIESIKSVNRSTMVEKGRQEKIACSKSQTKYDEGKRREKVSVQEKDAAEECEEISQERMLQRDTINNQEETKRELLLKKSSFWREVFLRDYKLMASVGYFSVELSTQNPPREHQPYQILEKGIEQAETKASDLKENEELWKEKRRQAKSEMLECSKKIGQAKLEEERATLAVQALHATVGALQAAIDKMDDASTYWRTLTDFIEQQILNKSPFSERDQPAQNMKLQDTMEEAMKKPTDEQRKFWRSKGFIREGILLYAKWVALRDHCESYSRQIREAGLLIKKYLRENPTVKDARDQLSGLAAEMNKRLAEEIAEMKGKRKRKLNQDEEHKEFGNVTSKRGRPLRSTSGETSSSTQK